MMMLGRRKNRRVEIVIVPNQTQAIVPAIRLMTAERSLNERCPWIAVYLSVDRGPGRGRSIPPVQINRRLRSTKRGG